MSEQEQPENQPVEFSNTNHQPVSVARISDILSKLGLAFETLDLHPDNPTLILPFGNGQVQVDQVDGSYVHVRSLYATEIPSDQLPTFYELMNQWNASNIEPTAFVGISEEAEISIRRPVGRSVAFYAGGASDFELAIFLQSALTSAHGFFVQLGAVFGESPDVLGGGEAQ